jgi:hypothetical protein
MEGISDCIRRRELGEDDGSLARLGLELSVSSLADKPRRREQFSQSVVLEIVATDSLLFVIDSRWQCLCVDKQQFALKLELTRPEELCRTLFYNRHNSTVMLVLTKNNLQFSYLSCRSYDLEDLKAGKAISSELFKEEDLRPPGFIEFDDLNKIVLTKSAANAEFKFWSMNDYSLLFCITDSCVEEIRLTNELVMLVHSPSAAHVVCKLVSASTGKFIDVFDISIRADRLIELLELFGCYLLLKQFSEPLLIINLLSRTRTVLHGFISPHHFIYLHEKELFMALRSSVIELWTFGGKLLKVFSTPVAAQTNGIIPSKLYISRAQDMMMSVCAEHGRSGRRQQVVKVYKLSSGELMREIKDSSALENLSAVTFDEHFAVMFTGHMDGSVTWWGVN